MNSFFYGNLVLISSFLFISFFSGCENSETKQGKVNLLQLGDNYLTVLQFDEAFQIAQMSYPKEALENKQVLNEMKSRFLKQMIEEMIILQRAKELQINISNDEVEEKIFKIKEDFPENTFEQILLENAVRYQIWKDRLIIRLMIEKVIKQDLEMTVFITAEDISHYIENMGDQLDDTSISTNSGAGYKKSIIRNIRREKTEKQYPVWLKNLKKKYNVVINMQVWEKMAS